MTSTKDKELLAILIDGKELTHITYKGLVIERLSKTKWSIENGLFIYHDLYSVIQEVDRITTIIQNDSLPSLKDLRSELKFRQGEKDFITVYGMQYIGAPLPITKDNIRIEYIHPSAFYVYKSKGYSISYHKVNTFENTFKLLCALCDTHGMEMKISNREGSLSLSIQNPANYLELACYKFCVNYLHNYNTANDLLERKLFIKLLRELRFAELKEITKDI